MKAGQSISSESGKKEARSKSHTRHFLYDRPVSGRNRRFVGNAEIWVFSRVSEHIIAEYQIDAGSGTFWFDERFTLYAPPQQVHP